MGDLFEWESGTSHATANVMAFGRRIAFEYSWNQALRSAWLPPGWQLPVAPRLLGPGLALAVLIVALGYLLWLTARGVAVCRPVPAILQLLILASLLIPNPAWAGGGGATSLRRWISHDHLGNAIRYTEPSGATVKGRTFEPFGKVIAETATTEATPQLFTGQRYETNTGLYDFRARWYDPEAGRFLSVDPVVQDVADPQTHNAYSYVRNNPINLVDPDGLGFWKSFLQAFFPILIVVAAWAIAYGGSAILAALGSLGAEAVEIGAVAVQFASGAAAVAGGASSLAEASSTIADLQSLPEVAKLNNARSPGQQPNESASQSRGFPRYEGRPDLPIEPLYPIETAIEIAFGIGILRSIGRILIGRVAARAGAKAAGEVITQAERHVLRDVFGKGPEGARRVLGQLEEGTFQLPRGLTRSALEKYRQVAQEAIDQGIDKVGTQTLRRDIIDRILRDYGSSLP